MSTIISDNLYSNVSKDDSNINGGKIHTHKVEKRKEVEPRKEKKQRGKKKKAQGNAILQCTDWRGRHS